MKELKSNMLVLFYVLLTLVACSDNSSELTPELVVSATELNFTNEEQTKSLTVSSNVEFTIESSASWCVVTPESAEAGIKTIKVTAAENTETEDRTATITITARDLTETILVQQDKNIVLVLETDEYTLNPEAQELTISFKRSGDVAINIDSDWISLKELKSEIEDSRTFIIEENSEILIRKGTITFTLEDISETATVTQEGIDPAIEADETGVESTAIDLAAKIIAGWNVGNSLEVPGGETNWGNPMVNKDLIDGVKAAGFNAVRIPCAWNGYIIDDETYEIDNAWLARVKEVVDYCVDNEMYAIINTHWDGGWLEEHPVYSKQEEINKQLYALWQQIGVYFRDYDEHLLFAGTNEVHEDYSEPSSENIEVQQSFNQTFVNAVRSTGGKNYYRNLIVQTYNTNIGWGLKYFELPTDVVNNRLFVEVHYYDPYEFTLKTDAGYNTQWGQGYTDVTSWGQEDYLQEQFGKMKAAYYDLGYPIILGEYGAIYRSSLSGTALQLHNESRNYFLKTVTSEAKANGFIPFIWDNGAGDFGLFNRSTGAQIKSDAIQAIIDGANN
ncbi:cellulase family glycosylhydrolase [Carboxylicivirga caseinilyticus]|uniref:cellulase family glycosylhydrolase n=1 Tax=Carboxylicivirga caseinilyticus TaxID=3417572 RepID=UPI003D33487A|nr:cellulase family glycosylhydrolase [Marinilabiliaceae bacterium A049]